MADINNKSIDELQSASAIADADLLVLQQNGVAKSVSGSVVKNFVGQKVVEELPGAVGNLGYDYVVESGVSGNWYYIKFAGGQAVLWGLHSITPTSSTATGSLYYSESIVLQTPFGIKSGIVSGNANALMWIANAGSDYSSSTIDFRLMRASPIQSDATNIKLSVWGLWI